MNQAGSRNKSLQFLGERLVNNVFILTTVEIPMNPINVYLDALTKASFPVLPLATTSLLLKRTQTMLVFTKRMQKTICDLARGGY